jgi:hypothetical protein
MGDGIVAALITGGISLAVSFLGLQKVLALVEYRIGELEKKQDRHNDFMVRLAKVEDSAKSAHHRINGIRE